MRTVCGKTSPVKCASCSTVLLELSVVIVVNRAEKANSALLDEKPSCYDTAMAITKSKLERLIKGAMGEVKADLIVTNGKVVNVYSGEILEGIDIAVLDNRICYVGPHAQHARGDHTEI